MANWNTGHNHFPADVGVQCGLIAATNVSSGSYADVSVTFPKAFQSVPVVVVGFKSESTAGTFGRCCVSVKGLPTTTGFTARIFNGDSSGRMPAVTWIAAGTPK